jgi:hypothetical protein
MIPELKELTPEQQKQVSKILLRAKLSLFFLELKTTVGLFLINIFSIFIGSQFLKNTDPEMFSRFDFVAMATNTIFMGVYFHKRLAKHHDIVKDKVNKIFNQ